MHAGRCEKGGTVGERSGEGSHVFFFHPSLSLPEGSDFTPSMTTPIAALYALPPGFFATAVADGDASPVADQLPPPDAAAEAVAPPQPRRASEPAEYGGALTCRACGIGERARG